MSKTTEEFLEVTRFTPMVGAKPFPAELVEAYRGRVPDLLIEYWQAFGQCGFNQGTLWLTNPDDFDYLLEDLLEGKQVIQAKDCSVIARSAFGHLHFWHRKLRGVFYMKMHDLTLNVQFDNREATAQADDRTIDVHLFNLKAYDNPKLDVIDVRSKYLLKRTQKALGAVNEDECYGFFPMIPMGGVATLENLQKVGLHSYLGILSQTAELRIMDLTAWPIKRIE